MSGATIPLRGGVCVTLSARGRYERESIERFWALDKGAKRDPLTNTPLAKGERRLFTNWHMRREVAGFLERHPHLTPSDWPDRRVPPPQPTTSVSNATEEVRTARERATARERRRRHVEGQVELWWWGRAARPEAGGDRQLQSFLVLASLLTLNVVVCVLSRRITSSGATLIGHPFSPLVHSHSSGPVTSATSAMAPASVLPPVCDTFLRVDAAHGTGTEPDTGTGTPSWSSREWMLPLPESSGGSGSRASAAVQYGSDRRLRVSYSRVAPKQYCLSPRRCTIHEDRNPRLRISITARYADRTTCVLVMLTFAWVAASSVWTGWSISVYWRWIGRRWQGDGEDLLLLPAAALSVLFTAPVWAVCATLLLQCAVATLAHTEMELSQTSWSLLSTMPGGWELERAIGDVDDIVGLRTVDTALWMPWPLDSAGLDGTAMTGGTHSEFGLDAVWQQAHHALLGSTAMEFSLAAKGQPPSRFSESDEFGQQEESQLTRHYEFGHGLSKEGTSDLVNAALTYLCRRQSSQRPH